MGFSFQSFKLTEVWSRWPHFYAFTDKSVYKQWLVHILYEPTAELFTSTSCVWSFHSFHSILIGSWGVSPWCFMFYVCTENWVADFKNFILSAESFDLVVSIPIADNSPMLVGVSGKGAHDDKITRSTASMFKMADMTAPQKWSQSVYITTWWLASGWGHKACLLPLSGRDMDQMKKSKIHWWMSKC